VSGALKVWSWRQAIQKAELRPTTKHVLLNLSVHMNDAGGSCFPTTALQARDTGLSERAVCTHLALAEQAGFLKRGRHGLGGQAWARTEYYATFPEGTELASVPIETSPEKGAERPSVRIDNAKEKGAEPASVPTPKALNVVPKGTEPDDITYKNNSSINSPKRKVPKRKAKTRFALPAWVPAEPWDGFVEMRQAKRKPLTDRAKLMAVARLAGLRDAGEDVAKVIDEATMSGWDKFYPISAEKRREFKSAAGSGRITL
jgi:hypothetical protein